jgi:hypothetical protein
MFSTWCKKMLLKSVIAGNIRFVEGLAFSVPSMNEGAFPKAVIRRDRQRSGIMGPQ